MAKTQAALLSAVRELRAPVHVEALLSDLARAAVPTLPGAVQVVRTKSILRDRLAAMVEDNTTGDISPADVRDVLGDIVDSMLAAESITNGTGIDVALASDGRLVISTAAAAAGDGLPSFLAAGARTQSADDTVEATITGRMDSLPFGSLVHVQMPDQLNRADDELMLAIPGTPAAALRRGDLAALRARDMTPKGLYEAIYTFNLGGLGRSYVISGIYARPQDYDLVGLFWVSVPTFAELQAQVDDPSLPFTSRTSRITIPAPRAGNAGLIFGVPQDAPDLTDLRIPGFTGIPYRVLRNTGLDVITYNGLAYKWWIGAARSEDEEIVFTYDPDY